MSTRLMIGLMIVYAAIAASAAWERNWWRCLYFIAAMLISAAVLGMQSEK